MSASEFPDIEIYVDDPDQIALDKWICLHFTIEQRRSETHLVLHDGTGSELECVIVPRAADGRFTSVWFRPNRTPWATDLDCARDAFGALGKEIRCSSGSWSSDDEAGGWLQINDAGTVEIDWQ